MNVDTKVSPKNRRAVDTIASINLLMSPKSIVFVGASTDIEKSSGLPVRNIAKSGYTGKVYAINRRGGMIGDISAYKSIAETPEPADIAFVTVKAAQCADTVRELAAKGTRVAVIAVGGFAETGSDIGRQLFEELLLAGQETGVRLVGPVCNGLYSTVNHLALGYNAIHQRTLKPGRIGFVSHSGALVAPFITMLEESGGGLSRFVSAGAEIDLGLADFISYFAEDKQTEVIALILDHVGNGDAFIAAVRRARRAGKEIVALKLGNSALGRDATLAHSSHLSGQKQVYDAVFAAEGIRSVPTVETLALTCSILSTGRRRTKGGVVACSTSGGGAITLADLFIEHQLLVPTLADRTITEIGNHLRFDAARIMNPFDLGLGGRDHYIANVASLARDPSAAALVVYGTPMSTPTKRAQLTDSAIEAARANPDLPVIYLSPAPLFEDEKIALQSGNIPLCTSTLDTVAVVKALLPVAAPVDVEPAAREKRGQPLPRQNGPLSEYRSKMLLRSFDIAMPAEQLARTIEEAMSAAQTIGFPVVLKASGQGIWHKSEHRLLELDIKNSEELSSAWARLEQRVGALKNIDLDGFLVASHLSDGVEALVGFSRDPEFGPVAVIGPGGILAELFGPTAMRHIPLPITPGKVIHALEGSPLAKLIQGFRGSEPHDLKAFAALVSTTAAMVFELGDDLMELDLNPVKILPQGKGAWALDALCVLAEIPKPIAQ